MIDWAKIKCELGVLVADISGLGQNAIRWMDESQGSTFQPDPCVMLRASSISREGIEEENRQDVANSVSVVTVAGQRRFTLSIRAESFTQDISDPRFAGNVIDAIAIRLMRSSSRERITSCAIESRQPTKWFNYVSGGRQVSAYVMDLMMRTIDLDIDRSAAAGSWIGRVESDDSDVTTDGIDNTVTLDVNPFSLP